MKIEAAQRLVAMYIKKGDNYRGGEEDALHYLERPFRWKVRAIHANQALVYFDMFGTVFALVSFSGKPQIFTKLVKSGKALAESGATSMEAFIVLDKSFEVDKVWVDSSLQGKGYGKALYKIAHDDSPRGLYSSTNLGTMSLAVWLSLYKSNPNIRLDVFQYGLVPREAIKVKGLEIFMKGEDYPLTDSKGSRFQFRWPK